MEVLLDTHTFLWWVTNDNKLSPTARTIISNPNNDICFSVVSAWEIVIKANLGKLPLPESPNTYIPERLKHYGFKKKSITLKDVLQVWQLANHHNDPFDRLLIAQSQTRNIPILSADRKLSLYNVNVLW